MCPERGVSLGDAKIPEAEKTVIARCVDSHLKGQPELIATELSDEGAEWVRRILQLAERSTSARPVAQERIDGELFEKRKSIEEGLRKNEADLFGSAGSVVLYDLTNTHFEGVCGKNPKARHGKNKQQRNDCRQVAIGMAFDSRGMALAHDVFEGNIAETHGIFIYWLHSLYPLA